MDPFDFRTGSLYALMAIASSVYLLWGFSIRLRPLLKAVLAIQIMGDLLFFNWMIDFDVYRYVRTLNSEDRIVPLLMLMACVFTMDAGAWLVNRLRRARRRAPRPGPSRSGGVPATNGPQVASLKLNETVARRFGITLVAIAILAKLLEMFFSGVLTGSSLFLGILNWQPEMSSGFTFLETLGLVFLPIGEGLLVMQTKRKPHWFALATMLIYGMLSPWKSGIVGCAIVYGFTVYQFGAREFRKMVFSRGAIASALAILLFLPLKAQFRYGQLTSVRGVELDKDALLDNFVGAAGARAMGGVFQAYVYVMNSLERGYPRMGGRYNAQVLYLWVPRLLWPNKPDTAGEDIYYYLELTKDRDEPYGTSFATTVFGTFNLDFGFWGSLVCSLLLGLFFATGERFLERLRNGRGELTKVSGVALTAIWLNATLAFSEGGVPPAITGMMIGATLVGLVWASLLFLSPKQRLVAGPRMVANRLPAIVRPGNLRPS